MKSELSFKTRVKETAIIESKKYNDYFVQNDYLICSSQFIENEYYIISGEKDNYLHLIGVNTHLSASDFFDKCYNGTLSENDFNFQKINENESSVKGSVRRKIIALERISRLFEHELLIEEDFKRNKIQCAIATTDGKITLGFTKGILSRPKTLLKGNELKTNPLKIELVLSKKRHEKTFNKIIIGNKDVLKSFYQKIEPLISKKLL